MRVQIAERAIESGIGLFLRKISEGIDGNRGG